MSVDYEAGLVYGWALDEVDTRLLERLHIALDSGGCPEVEDFYWHADEWSAEGPFLATEIQDELSAGEWTTLADWDNTVVPIEDKKLRALATKYGVPGDPQWYFVSRVF